MICFLRLPFTTKLLISNQLHYFCFSAQSVVREKHERLMRSSSSLVTLSHKIYFLRLTFKICLIFLCFPPNTSPVSHFLFHFFLNSFSNYCVMREKVIIMITFPDRFWSYKYLNMDWRWRSKKKSSAHIHKRNSCNKAFYSSNMFF